MVERHCFFREKAGLNASTLPFLSRVFLENVFSIKKVE
jgi:hypothetical protein